MSLLLLLGETDEITGEQLTTGSSSTDATSYVTASIHPGPNKLVLLAVYNAATGASPVPTVTGNGLTWVRITDADALYDVSGTFGTLHVFRAMGASPSAGAVTIDFGATTVLGCGWQISELGNVDTTGTNGSGAIVQADSAIGLGNSALVTLAAFSNSANATYGALAQQHADIETLGSGFIRLGRSTTTPPLTSITAFWQRPNDTTVDASWTTATDKWGIAGIEVKAAAAVEEHSGSVTATGGGVSVLSMRKGGQVSIVGTGGGVGAVTETSAHVGAVTGTGSGTAVTSRSGAHVGAITSTGGGIASLSAAAGRATSVTATGAGAGTVSQSTQRFASITATGGGVVTYNYTAGQPEQHSGSVTATGAGVAVLQVSAGRQTSVAATGGGVSSLTGAASRQTSVTATGGGIATVTSLIARTATIVATGGGAASLSVTSARYLAALLSGGGVMTSLQSGAHFGAVQGTGGGSGTVNGSGTTTPPLRSTAITTIEVPARPSAEIN